MLTSDFQDKFAYLEEAQKQGVINIEMEIQLFGAFLNYVGIRAAAMCVTLLVGAPELLRISIVLQSEDKM